MPTDPKKRTIARSFADAFRGVGDCIRTERNMRIHLTMCVYVLFFASRIELTRGEMACLLLAIGSVMTAETLNTSVEKLCDFTQKHTNHPVSYTHLDVYKRQMYITGENTLPMVRMNPWM